MGSSNEHRGEAGMSRAEERGGTHALDKAIRALQPGYTLVTARLDRLARSIRDLLSLVDTVQA